MEELVNAINNLTIKDSEYELNTTTTSDAQGNLTSYQDTVTDNSNGISDKKILSCRTIGEVSILPMPTNLKSRLAPQTLLMPAVKEIFADATSGNGLTNGNPR